MMILCAGAGVPTISHVSLRLHVTTCICVGVSDNHLVVLCLYLMLCHARIIIYTLHIYVHVHSQYMQLFVGKRESHRHNIREAWYTYSISKSQTFYAKQKDQAAVLQLKILCSVEEKRKKK